jgi:hypothetical protein
MSQDGDHLSSPLIWKLILSHCPQWLVGEITANVLMVGALTMMIVSPFPLSKGGHLVGVNYPSTTGRRLRPVGADTIDSF